MKKQIVVLLMSFAGSACDSKAPLQSEPPGSAQSAGTTPSVSAARAQPRLPATAPAVVEVPRQGKSGVIGAAPLVDGPRVYDKSEISFDVSGLRLGMTPEDARSILGELRERAQGFEPLRGQFVAAHPSRNFADGTTFVSTAWLKDVRSEIGSVQLTFAEIPQANSIVRVDRSVRYPRNASTASTQRVYLQALIEKYGAWDFEIRNEEGGFEVEWVFGGVRCRDHESQWNAGNMGFDIPDPKTCGGILNVKGTSERLSGPSPGVVSTATFVLENPGAVWLARQRAQAYRDDVVSRWQRAKQAEVNAGVNSKPTL